MADETPLVVGSAAQATRLRLDLAPDLVEAAP